MMCARKGREGHTLGLQTLNICYLNFLSYFRRRKNDRLLTNTKNVYVSDDENDDL